MLLRQGSTPSPTNTDSVVQEAVSDDLVSASAPTVLLYLGVGVAAALVLGFLVTALVRRIGRHSLVAADVERRGRRPFRILLVLLAARVVLEAATLQQGWAEPLAYVANLLIIANVAWLVIAVAFVLEDLTLSKYRLDSPDNRRARRVRTQVSLLRRLTVAVVVVLAVGAMLLTIPQAREWGATIFASAGVVGIVAGLAAQTSLANLFAGLQIAFTDGIRVDDVVVVEGEWGRIEEITLTYVVVHIWDDRRLILPSTYFTSTPFENWTRKDTQMLGAVMLDLDWGVPLEGLRAELQRYVESSPNWDGRLANIQVTDAVGGVVQLRVLVSAHDGATLWDLRTGVREALVVYLQRHHPDSLPRTRISSAVEAPEEVMEGSRREQPHDGSWGRAASTGEQPAVHPTTGEQGLFTGSIEAVQRARDFQGPSEEDMEERRRTDAARAADREGEPVDGETRPRRVRSYRAEDEAKAGARDRGETPGWGDQPAGPAQEEPHPRR